LDSNKALEVDSKILEIQELMIAFVTDGRTDTQPLAYRELYGDIYIDIEESKYANPNPHISLEIFWAFCKLQELTTYSSRRVYIQSFYSDILFDLKRIQRHAPSSKNWEKANEALGDNLTPVRAQWLKAKNFISAPTPDYENAIKEAINSIESCLMILLNQPSRTLGQIIKKAELDPDIERLISQAYGLASNKAFVRHGGAYNSTLGKDEAEFFLELSASATVYIIKKLKTD
jgi:hypothetical protein